MSDPIPGDDPNGALAQFMSIEHVRNLTADDCDELAEALRHHAAVLPDELKKANLLWLAECYRNLAQMKRLVSRNVN